MTWIQRFPPSGSSASAWIGVGKDEAVVSPPGELVALVAALGPLVVHMNAFDRLDDSIDITEQQCRSDLVDVSADGIADLARMLRTHVPDWFR